MFDVASVKILNTSLACGLSTSCMPSSTLSRPAIGQVTHVGSLGIRHMAFPSPSRAFLEENSPSLG